MTPEGIEQYDIELNLIQSKKVADIKHRIFYRLKT